MPAVVRIKEIATELSVSSATVSRTLKGHYGRGATSLATARRILNYCFRSGYLTEDEKDRVLLKIQIRVSNKKAFCLSCFEGLWNYNAIFSSVSRSLQERWQYSGVFTVLSNGDLQRFPYDEACVILVFGRITAETYEALSKSGIPIVLGDNNIPKSNWSTVNSDNLEAASRAVEVLVGLGHKRIAFMCRHEDFPRRTYNLHQRQNGYVVGMSNAGLSCDGLIVTKDSENNYTPATHEEVMSDLRRLAERVIELNPMPTAVVAANDSMAHILRTVLREKGLRVPEDMSIIGYDGQHKIAGAMAFVEPVSTMVVNWEEMGQAMVDLTMDFVLDPESHVRHILIPAYYEDLGTVARL